MQVKIFSGFLPYAMKKIIDTRSHAYDIVEVKAPWRDRFLMYIMVSIITSRTAVESSKRKLQRFIILSPRSISHRHNVVFVIVDEKKESQTEKPADTFPQPSAREFHVFVPEKPKLMCTVYKLAQKVVILGRARVSRGEKRDTPGNHTRATKLECTKLLQCTKIFKTCILFIRVWVCIIVFFSTSRPIKKAIKAVLIFFFA